MLALHSRLGSNWEPWTLHHRGIQRQEVIPDKPGVYEIGFLVPFSPSYNTLCAIQLGSSSDTLLHRFNKYLRKDKDGLKDFESFEKLGLTMAYRCSLGYRHNMYYITDLLLHAYYRHITLVLWYMPGTRVLSTVSEAR